MGRLFGPHAVAWLGGPGCSGLGYAVVPWAAVGSGCSGAAGCPRPAGRVRRRWDVAGRWDVADAVGWRSAGHRVRGSAASRPRGRPGGGLGRAGPGSPGRWGRHGASGAGGGRRTRLRGRVQSGKTQPPSRTARALRWAGWMTRVARPTSKGWVGAPPRVGGSRAMAAWSRPASPSVPLGWWGSGGASAFGSWAGRWCLAAGVLPVVVARVLAGDQHPGHGPVTRQSSAGLGVQRPGPADLPTDRLGVAQQAVQVHDHAQLRAAPHRPGAAAHPPGRGGPTRPGHQRCVGCRSWCRGRRLGGPTVPGRPADSGRPRVPTAHPPRPCLRRSGPATTPGGHDGAPGRDPRRQGRRPGAGARGAAAADLGPAAGPPGPAPVRPRRSRGRAGAGCRRRAPGRGRPTAPHRTPPGRFAVSGPRNRARAVRTALVAARSLRCSRFRSQAAVEPDLLAGFGAGGAAGVDPGQFFEPLAVQAVHHPPQPPGPARPGPRH